MKYLKSLFINILVLSFICTPVLAGQTHYGGVLPAHSIDFRQGTAATRGFPGTPTTTLDRNDGQEYNYDGDSLELLVDDEVRIHSTNGAGFEPAVANLLPFKDFDTNWSVNAGVNYQRGGTTYWRLIYGGTGASTNTLDEDSVRSAASARSIKTAITDAGGAVGDIRFISDNSNMPLFLTAGTAYIVSFYAKASGAKTIPITLVNSGVGDQNISVTTTWQKFEVLVSAISTTTTAYIAVKLGDNGLYDFYIDAISFEESSFASSRWIGGDAAVGADLGTDSDCSGGTLTTGAGWAHDAGNNEYDATASSADLTDGGILTAGVVYRLKVVFANDGGGSFIPKLGGVSGTAIDANGTYYQYIIAGGTDLVFDATGLTGSIQSYEVKTHGSVGVSESAQLSYTLPTSPTGGALFAETLGAEINSGTLTLGLSYNITADTGGDFYAGSAVGEYFVSDGTETADGDSKVKNVTNAYDSGTGLLPPHATVMVWVRFGFAKTDVSLDFGILSIRNAANSLMGPVSGAFHLYSYDGVTFSSNVYAYVANTLYKIVVQYGYLISNVLQFRVGIDTGSGISWGTAQTYDGAYTTGTDLILAHTPFGPIDIQQLMIFSEILDDTIIDGLGF